MSPRRCSIGWWTEIKTNGHEAPFTIAQKSAAIHSQALSETSAPRRVLSSVSAGAPDGVTDADPFEAFVRAHQDMVFATAVRLLGRVAEAEDVSQMTFLKAFERFDVIRNSPSAAGWLRTVTRNACLNHLTRHRARWRLFSELPGTESAEGLDDYVSALAGDALPVAPDKSDEDDREGRLEEALRRLPDAQRVPLVLFHLEEASYQEIAETLSVSLGKVKTDIHRGREALRKYLTDDRPR